MSEGRAAASGVTGRRAAHCSGGAASAPGPTVTPVESPMHRLRPHLALAAVVLLAACGARHERAPVAESGELIPRHEIEAAHTQTVWELVERLHPQWLRKRGVNHLQNEGDVVVYLDNARLGGPETLREIHVGGVSSVRYYDAAKAQYRFGVGHTHGAILVSTGVP
jgi:hypothetical protein